MTLSNLKQSSVGSPIGRLAKSTRVFSVISEFFLGRDGLNQTFQSNPLGGKRTSAIAPDALETKQNQGVTRQEETRGVGRAALIQPAILNIQLILAALIY